VHATSWLQLLDDDAPAAEVDALRRQLVAEVTPTERPGVEADAARAMRVRARLEASRQQAEELVVLNDLARRLATLRDSADVLQEVTAQARRLLAVEVAYIMLLRETGRLRIEVSDGSMGTVLRGIELGPGEGLGGRVMATGAPVWSRSYLEDEAFPHQATLDEAATVEHLGGILGVPLMAGDEAIGVLLAAERRPRVFAAREIQLLAALASHAAVAIRNARLFEENRAALEDLRRVNASLEHDNEVRQRINALRERLTTGVVHGGGVARIAAEMSAATGQPVSVYGSAHERVAGSHAGSLEDLLGAPQAAAVRNGADPAAVLRLTGADGVPVLVAPARLPSGYAGCMAVSDGSADPDLARVMPVGAAVLAIVVSSERMLEEADLRTRGEFFSALFAPDVDRRSIRRRARAVGIDLDRVSACAVFDDRSDDGREAGRLAARLAGEVHGWSAEHRDHVVVLVPDVVPDQVRERLDRLRRGPLPAAVGLAPCAGGVDAVRESYELARQTATVLHALGRSRDAAQVADLGVYRSLFSLSGRDEIVGFIERAVGPVIAYDAERQRDLGPTLLTYLQHAQHHARTCQLLHVHANTLYQRLDRVTALLGDDWREPDRALEIQLALKMHGLLGSLAAASS
jgi:hypothetical protein